jgi:hypothetical protein
MADEVNVIRKNTGIANNACGRTPFENRDIITRNRLSDARLTLWGTI